MRIPFQLSIMASAVVLAECGGGGPGGSNVDTGSVWCNGLLQQRVVSANRCITSYHWR